MADLLDIPTPLQVGVEGTWNNEPFVVEGRIQMDRAGAPGAPWQEILVGFPNTGSHTWVAYAQGRWYGTNEQPMPPGGVPPVDSLAPGAQVDLGPNGVWVVSEVGQRRVVSGEGELSNVPAPGVVTRYADISAAGARFGTIDYGDGSEPPELYLGQQFDPAIMQLADGMPIEPSEAQTQALECPNCGGNLPILSQQSERIVCQYCGTASDISHGALAALGPAPRPPIQPAIPIGAEGNLRGNHVVCCGFMIRSCMVEGVAYPWREYLLYAGDRVGYQWLSEEDGAWQHIVPMEAGDVMDGGHSVTVGGGQFALKQTVMANVDYVIGEFYWKVEIGERVEATEFAGPGGKVSREKTATEVNYSFCTAISPGEVFAAFGLAAPAGAAASYAGGSSDGSSGSGCSNVIVTIIVILVICGIIGLAMAGACGGGGGSVGGGSWGGK
jgi:ribosomal protein S27AE